MQNFFSKYKFIDLYFLSIQVGERMKLVVYVTFKYKDETTLMELKNRV